jgi:hypothetical protein
MRAAEIERFHASFCEIERERAETLARRTELDERCFVHHGDNTELAYAVPGIIRHYGESPRYAIGTVLCDPNGNKIPVESLAWLAGQCPRMDFIVHWNSTGSKRQRNGCKPEDRSLRDVIEALNKKYWLIREPTGIHQFTLVIGRNFQAGDYKAQGFHHIDSLKGTDMLNRCDLTRRGYAELAGSRQLGMPI